MADKRPSYPITDEWRERVRARMEELHLGPVELAARAKTTHGTINHMLSTSRSSRWVPAVHAALEWPAPAVPEDSREEDPRLTEIRRGWTALDERARSVLHQTFQALSGDR